MDDFAVRRTAHPSRYISAALVALLWSCASFATPIRFDIDAGDARYTIGEFSRQANVQSLFDFASLRGVRTHAVHGIMEPAAALSRLMAGTNVKITFVNPRTLAITLESALPPVAKSPLSRWWERLKQRRDDGPDGIEQVVVSAHSSSPTVLDVGAPLIQLSRPDIDQSGMATVPDLIDTLPQIFGGGPTDHTVLGREAETNASRGAGFNLRGLDAGAAVILLDGQRIAASGTAGAYTDVANLPLSAIERIDILPDGASTRYGADAVSGVVNFVTRRNVEGAETLARWGSVTRGALSEQQYGQLVGGSWDSGRAVLSLEYYEQDALPARDRGQATSDLTRWGGTNYDTPYGDPGTILAGGQTWAIPTLPGGQRLTATDLKPTTQNLYDQWSGADALPRQQHLSFVGNLRQSVSDTLELSLMTWLSRREADGIVAPGESALLTVPATNAYYVNPTGGGEPVSLLYGFGQALGPTAADAIVDSGNVTLGLRTQLSAWALDGSLGYAFERLNQSTYNAVDFNALDAALADPNPGTAFNAFGTTNRATLDAIRTALAFRSLSELRSLKLTVERPLLSMHAGDVKLTLGAEYRQQSLTSLAQGTITAAQASNDLTRSVRAGFAELQLPLFDENNRRLWAEKMNLSLGARYEDNGGLQALAPRFGATWSPVADLTVRSTWSRAFRSPTLTDLSETGNSSTLAVLPDAKSPTGSTTALIWSGNNADLREEHARTWTLGADLTHDTLSLGATYFDIDSVGRVDEPQLSFGVLEDPTFSGAIIRNPTSAQQANVCTRSTFVGDTASCAGATIGVIVDARLQNLDELKTRGIDLLGKYALNLALGRVEMGLNATYLLAYARRLGPGSASISLLDTENEPIDLRLRGSLSWERHGISAVVFVNYQDRYRDVVSQPTRSVSSWTTLDGQLSYRLRGMQWSLSAQNLFDRGPPFLNNSVGIGYDQENGNLLGRLISISLRWDW